MNLCGDILPSIFCIEDLTHKNQLLTVVRPKKPTKKPFCRHTTSHNLNDEAAVPEAKPAHTKEPKRVGVMGWGGIWW